MTFLSHYLLVTRAIGGDLPGAWPFIGTVAVSFGATLLLLGMMTRLFRSERIVFGR